MKKLRRHWPLISVVCLGVVLTGTFWLSGSRSSEVQAQVPPEPVALTAVERDLITGVMDESHLDRDALIALNLSAVQAADIMETCRTWCLAQQATLATHNTTIAAKVLALRNIKAAIRQGPPNPEHAQQLATAQSELATARAAYASTINALATSVSSELSASQRTTWDAIKQGLGQTMPIRMLALTAQQRTDLSRALRRHKWRMAAASTTDEQSAALTAHNTALSGILTPEQQQVISSFNSNYADTSAVIAGAVADELPLPSAS